MNAGAPEGRYPGPVEAVEASAQLTFVRESNALPIALDRGSSPEEFEALGITLGAPIDGLFRWAQLPAGWSMRVTESSHWSDVVDDTGAVCVEVFYKASPYDRRASMRIKKGALEQTLVPGMIAIVCDPKGNIESARRGQRGVVLSANVAGYADVAFPPPVGLKSAGARRLIAGGRLAPIREAADMRAVRAARVTAALAAGSWYGDVAKAELAAYEAAVRRAAVDPLGLAL